MPRALLMAGLVGSLILACESGTAPEAPTGAEARPQFAARPNPSFQPFAFVVSNCVETVAVSGTFHENLRFFVGANGREHARFHINAKGIGVGQLTGARYQWNDRLFDNTNITLGQTGSFTRVDRTRLIGQGGAVDATFAVQVKVTINANGTIKVDRLAIKDVCR